MNTRSSLFALLLLVTSTATLQSQQSDYAVAQNFQETYKAIVSRMETSLNVGELDSLRAVIDTLQVRYQPQAKLLDRVLYPETFESKMQALRTSHALTYDRVFLISTQGVRLEELEMKILYLSNRLDTLTAERDKLLAEVKTLNRSTAQYREAIRRLQANLAAKDRLLFALIDTLFQPYGTDLSQGSDVRRESFSRQMEKANLLTRVEAVATDNVGFLQKTELQPKDYAGVVDRYQEFSTRWQNLREQIIAASVAGTSGEPRTKPSTSRQGEGGSSVENPATRIDSLVQLWGSQLQREYWNGLAKEFVDRGIPIESFKDGNEFSTRVQAYVKALQESGDDPTHFIDDVWKARIDKEWRESLVKPAMLGAEGYAALDRTVSELGRPAIDGKLILYAVIFVTVIALVWWLFARKPKQRGPAPKSSDS